MPITHRSLGIVYKSIRKSFLSTARLDSLRHQLQQEHVEEQEIRHLGKRGTKKNLIKPAWLKAEVPKGVNYESLRSTVKSLNLATVCEEAKCPNIGGGWFLGYYCPHSLLSTR